MNVSLLVESVFTLAFFGGGPWELAILGGIALLVFGNRLPGAAKSLGMSFSAFKKGIKEGEDDLDDDRQSPSPPQTNVGSQTPPENVESQAPSEKVESQS